MEESNLVTLAPLEGFGHGFVPERFLADGMDGDHFRFERVSMEGYRHLTAEEIESLKAYGNSSPDWDDVYVKDPFDPSTVRRTSLWGLCRLGPFEKLMISYHDFHVETGITDSRIISSDILANAAVHNCPYVSNYIIGEESIVYRVGELQTTNHAKFGAGVVKEGEEESVRVTIDLMNEAGGREVMAFPGMNTADAWLWAKKRDHGRLMERFKDFTEDVVTAKRGVYGEVGRHSVIKSCHIIKDVMFGPGCYVKGCNKLKNLTIDSSEEEPVQLGEGIELVNGIVGRGSRVFYGCKAIRFVITTHCNVKYGARLLHTFLGDNSTISCCEVLNNLVFPFHEEHHNNSFLIASLVMGQSNMAAGATVGSNHNSRGNDGELVAGRGFWPALSSTVKHDSRFASYVLLTKGNYPSELDIRLPFSMVTDNQDKGRREIMPAYWWMYNMYALARNSWKFSVRDKRHDKPVMIETDFLAPDTAWEIIEAVRLLELWCGHSAMPHAVMDDKEAQSLGQRLLSQGGRLGFDVFAEGVERSPFPVKILKPSKAWKAYHEMLLFYGMKTVSCYALRHGLSFHEALKEDAKLYRFENMGGQLVPSWRLDALINDVESGRVGSWDSMHASYKELARLYDEDRLENASAILGFLASKEGKQIEDLFPSWDRECQRLNGWIQDEAVKTKLKDYSNAFRHITYDNEAEREAVLGSPASSVNFTLPHYDKTAW